MDRLALRKYGFAGSLVTLLLATPGIGSAQVPVDDAGQSIAATTEEIPLLSATELADLVGPIALYPDDLLAIVLPATTYPLQLVQAERFLGDLKSDPSLKPDEDWDDSVVALINYPEVVELLTDELDQTWRLGEAVVTQQADVIAAIESFRDRAHAAGNLQSDSHQTVSQKDGVIEITPVAEDVIYVPYYEPEQVVVYQSRPAYYYYPQPYPVYYYPYPYGYAFNNGFFWGVTTAFAVGWYTDSLHVYHHSYYGHPYYGHSYYHYNHWYRHYDIHAHNDYYYGGHSDHHGHNGHHWQAHSGSTVSHHDQRVTRSRQYPGTATRSSTSQTTDSRQAAATKSSSRQLASGPANSLKAEPRESASRQTASRQTADSRSEIRFRERDATRTTPARPTQSAAVSTARTSKAVPNTPEIKFRERPRETQVAQRPSSESKPATTRPVTTSSRQSQERLSQPSRSSYQASNSSQPSRSNKQPSYSNQASGPRAESSGSNRVASASKSSASKGSARDRQ